MDGERTVVVIDDNPAIVKAVTEMVELIGFKRPGLPYLNVIAVYTFNEDNERMYTDYWCDICSIPMYMIQPCDCCQGDIRLRFQQQDLPDYIEDAGESSTSK